MIESAMSVGRELVAGGSAATALVKESREAAMWTDRSHHLRHALPEPRTFDCLALGYRFCIWSLVHPVAGRYGARVTHWGLAVEPHPGDAQALSADRDAVLRAVWADTGADALAFATSCYVFAESHVLLHFRWHDDGTAPSVAACALERGIAADAWRLTTVAEIGARFL